MAVSRRNPSGRFFEGRAAIVQRQRFENFIDGIRLVADRPRAWRECATARAATEERNGLKLFLARAFFDEAFAVAVWATIGMFY